jgi:hypothetical protein
MRKAEGSTRFHGAIVQIDSRARALRYQGAHRDTPATEVSELLDSPLLTTCIIGECLTLGCAYNLEKLRTGAAPRQ